MSFTVANRITRIVSPAIALVVPSLLMAQNRLPSVPQDLSLEDAVGIALDWNPAYRQQSNDSRATGWGVRSAYASFLPNLSMNGSLSYAGEGESRFANTVFTQPSVKSSSYSISLNWSLNQAVLAQPGLQQSQADAAQARANSARINVFSQMVQQYLNVLQAQDEVALAEAQLRSGEETIRLTQGRRDVGQANILDVRQAEVQRGRAEVQLLREQQDVTVEKLRLFQQMGIPAPEDVSQVRLTDTFSVIEPRWNLSELIDNALMDNPDLNALRAQERASGHGVAVARSGFFPSINASASWSGYTQVTIDPTSIIASDRAQAQASYNSCLQNNAIRNTVNELGAGVDLFNCDNFLFTDQDEADIIAANSTWPFEFTRQPFRAQVFVQIPIFNGFSTLAQVSQAAVQHEDAREAVRARELQVETDVTQAFNQMTTTWQTIAIQERNRAAALDAEQVATQRYRQNQETFVNLLTTQVAARQAELDYIRSVYDYHRALAGLEAAVGSQLR